MRRSGTVLLAVSAAMFFAGLLLPQARDGLWLATGVLGAVASFIGVTRGLLARRGGVDVLALLAIVGALIIGEYLAA
ncbi:MAG TPA: hypothetical protein P5544_18060, partial [Candidatus Nanopelagicales bacterium]|nr:hypothetical protein [Candidatus Nanopelagicales bacterium]